MVDEDNNNNDKKKCICVCVYLLFVCMCPHLTMCVFLQEVYTGEERVCTIDGLHFDSIYRARVRAFNNTGTSPFCEPLCLQTAQGEGDCERL